MYVENSVIKYPSRWLVETRGTIFENLAYFHYLALSFTGINNKQFFYYGPKGHRNQKLSEWNRIWFF